MYLFTHIRVYSPIGSVAVAIALLVPAPAAVNGITTNTKMVSICSPVTRNDVTLLSTSVVLRRSPHSLVASLWLMVYLVIQPRAFTGGCHDNTTETMSGTITRDSTASGTRGKKDTYYATIKCYVISNPSNQNKISQRLIDSGEVMACVGRLHFMECGMECYIFTQYK